MCKRWWTAKGSEPEVQGETDSPEGRIDILDTRKIKDDSGQPYEAISVRAESKLVRIGAVKSLAFHQPHSHPARFVSEPNRATEPPSWYKRKKTIADVAIYVLRQSE